MSRTENVELTVLCLITDGDRILLQNRTKNDWQGYTLPGGHVEHGESFVDVVLLFKATEYSGTVVSSDEGQMEWVKSNHLPEINTVDDFEDLLRVINDPALTEFQYLVDGETWTVSIK